MVLEYLLKRKTDISGIVLFDKFLFLGGIVANSDYGRRPHCFDTCHILGGSLQRPSTMSSPLPNKSSYSIPSLTKLIEGLVTTPTCFEIEPLLPSSSEQTTSSSSIFVDESISHNTSNTSLSASAITITSSSWLSIILTFIFVFQMKFLQDL